MNAVGYPHPHTKQMLLKLLFSTATDIVILLFVPIFFFLLLLSQLGKNYLANMKLLCDYNNKLNYYE